MGDRDGVDEEAEGVVVVKRTLYAMIATYQRGLVQAVIDFEQIHETQVAVQEPRRVCSSNKRHVLSVSGHFSVEEHKESIFQLLFRP